MTILVGLRGNFGNQLFISAAALSLAARYGTDLMVDYRHVRRPGQPGCRIRAELLGSALECRDWNALFAVLRATPHTRLHQRLARRLPYREIPGVRSVRDLAECDAALSGGDDILLAGYFQEPQIDRWRQDGTLDRVDDLIPKESTQGRHPLVDGGEPFTAVHVRRGDYVTIPRNVERLGVCTADYFVAAVNGLPRSLPVLLVTDDADWCEQELLPRLPAGTRVARGGSAMSDFDLLRQAQQIVISNSSFSWWAAVLGRATTVVAPVPWFNVPGAGAENLPQPQWRLRDKTSGAG